MFTFFVPIQNSWIFILFFQTTHNYELTLLNHSVIEVEANSNRTNDVPTIEYNFVKVQDIINVSSDDKIDVLVVCSHVGSCVNQTTRAGRETKKREIQVTDESKSEIQLTFWGDKAEKYDESSLLGKFFSFSFLFVSCEITYYKGCALWTLHIDRAWHFGITIL